MDKYTSVLLNFKESPTKDECGNSWLAFSNNGAVPTIGSENAKFGSSLQLDGANYIQSVEEIPLGGADFTIDFWFCIKRCEGFTFSGLCGFDDYVRDIYYAYDTVLLYLNDYGYADGNLHHIAFIYLLKHNLRMLFVDGVLISYATRDYMAWDERRSSKIKVGGFFDTRRQSGIGTISEFRISDGVARFITDSNGELIDSSAITIKREYWLDPDEPGYDDAYDEYLVVNNVGEKWFDPPDTPYSLVDGFAESASFDTCRVLASLPVDFDFASANTRRHIPRGYESAQTFSLRRLLDGAAVPSARRISRKETVSATTVRRRPIDLRYVTVAPAKNLLRSSASSLIDTFKDYNVTEFNVTLQEMTLSDRFSLSTTNSELDIFSAIKGQLFNYDFTFLVEEVNEQHGIKTLQGLRDKHELLYSLLFSKTRFDTNGNEYGSGSAIDFLNPLPLSDTAHILPSQRIGAQTIFYATASYFVLETAKYLGLLCDINIDDFCYSGSLSDVKLTYRDMISNLFSWTKQVPRRQINAFLRGNTLYVVQRGKEDSSYDITDLPHSEPVFKRSIERTMYNRPGGSFYAEDTDDDLQVPFDGVITFSDDRFDHVLYYRQGFLRSETHNSKHGVNPGNDSNFTSSTTTYDYISRKTNDSISGSYINTTDIVGTANINDYDFYLSRKVSTNTSMDAVDHASEKQIQHITTTYHYSTTDGDGYYLANEYEVTTEENFVKAPGSYSWTSDGSETTIRTTLHVPLGNGWYGTTVKVDGKNEGSSISQGNPDNKVSPYTVHATQSMAKIIRTFSVDSIDSDSTLVPIDSFSFPVFDVSDSFVKRSTLIQELRWMNMKVREQVTVTLWTPIVAGVPKYDHVVDFTERVILDGHEYFLVSNQITFTPRQLSQQLELVRWF